MTRVMIVLAMLATLLLVLSCTITTKPETVNKCATPIFWSVTEQDGDRKIYIGSSVGSTVIYSYIYNEDGDGQEWEVPDDPTSAGSILDHYYSVPYSTYHPYREFRFKAQAYRDGWENSDVALSDWM
jgi:hypothetical protein